MKNGSKIPKKTNYVVFREQLEFYMKKPQNSLATIRDFIILRYSYIASFSYFAAFLM